jgi:hypothetical protein
MQKGFPHQSSTAVASTLQLPAIFLGGVAPLMATPNVDEAIEDKKIGKKATLQATHVIHTCRKESLFFLQTNWTKS